jgi:alkylresorcinol/alkylpyrone synthase
MNLKSLASAFPPHAYSQADCLEAIQRSPVVRTLRSRSLKLLERILAADSGIDRRHFYLPEPAEIFSRDAQTLNQLFEIQAPALAGQALDAALDRAGLKASHLDALFVCTCTGYLCPGITSHVSEQAGLKPDAYLQDLVGLGCGAAIPLLQSADGFLHANPGARVATIAVEICSAAFFIDDDPGVLISLCLFGDGAAAAIWSGDDAGNGWRVDNFQTLHWPQHREKIRFVNAFGQLKNKLHRSVPGLAAQAVSELFESSGCQPDAIIAHTGGRDVLQALEDQLPSGPLTASREVLRKYGNISSPSVLVALEEHLARGGNEKELWLTSFGAGFSAHACRLSRGTGQGDDS